MKLTLAESRLLKESVGIISELVSEANLRIAKDRIELIAMDPANVVMVVFKLLSSAFIEYNVEKEEVIAVNLDSLNQVLRRTKPNDTISLELDEDSNKLKIVLAGDSHRTFNLRLISLDEREQKVPELNFNANIETDSGILENAIEDVGIIAESVAFFVDKDKFQVKSEGNISDAKVELKKDENVEIRLDGSKAAAKYSVEYLKKIIKGGKLSDKVNIQFSNDYPLKVDYNVLNKLGLSFILAPRVSNE